MSNFNVCEKEVSNLDSFFTAVAAASAALKDTLQSTHDNQANTESRHPRYASSMGSLAISQINIGEF